MKREPQIAWTSDDFVTALVEFAQQKLTKLRLFPSRANAVKLLLGKPLRRGLISARIDTDCTTEELMQLKAQLFDKFFEVYGRNLAPDFRLGRSQRHRSAMAVSKRKANSYQCREKALAIAALLRGRGIPERNVAAMVARKLDRTPTHVRALLRKAKATQG